MEANREGTSETVATRLDAAANALYAETTDEALEAAGAPHFGPPATAQNVNGCFTVYAC